MVFNATFNNISAISWLSVLLVKETGENHQPVASHWQTLSHNVVLSDLRQVGGFSPGTSFSSTNESDRHDITEILLKMALNTINQTTKPLKIVKSAKLKVCPKMTSPKVKVQQHPNGKFWNSKYFFFRNDTSDSIQMYTN